MSLINRRNALKGLATTALGAAALPSFKVIAHGQGSLTKVSLTLPWMTIGSYAAFIMARDFGFWRDRGLDVEVSRGYGSADASKKVGLGRFDYGDASFPVVAQTAAQGMDLVNLGLHIQVSPLAIFSLKERGISSPKDLEGKNIGATPTTGDYHLFPAFAAAAGLDTSKVNFTFLDGNVRAQALLNGSVDALTGYYSTDAAPLWTGGGDVDIMLYANHGLTMYDTGIFALRSQVEEYREVTAALVEGAMEGLKFTYLNPEETLDAHIAAIPEYQGSEENRETLKHQIAINTALGLHPGPIKNGLGYFIHEEVEETVSLVEKYLDADGLDPARLYTNDFVGSVKLTDQQWKTVRESVASYIL